MTSHRLLATVLAVAGVGLSTGCASESACDQMRRELADLSAEMTPEAAWQDINALQEVVSRALALRNQIAQECSEL